MRIDSLKLKMAVAVAALLLAISASATIINVPDDYPAIQQGIDASSDGDTVLVQPGTYVENINFNGHNIVLGSLFLTTGDTAYIAETVIDGGGSGSVITFESDEDSTSVISGFQIQNGNDNLGGGILCESSSPVIEHNTISQNSAVNGGGIHCNNSFPKLIYNIITENIAENGGAGIDILGGSPELYGCLISENFAGSYGGGISNDLTSPTIANCVITANSTAGAGGGVSNYTYSDATFINCTFFNNSAGYGGAVWNGASTPRLINCILWWDTPDELSGFQSDISYSDIQGGCEGEGNIEADPVFRDWDYGDFHLMSISCGDPYDSPCIDAGNPAIIDSLIDCSWGSGTTRSDMGAFAGGVSVCDNYIVGDYNGSGAFNVVDVIEAFSKLKTASPDYPERLCECPPESGSFWYIQFDLNNSCSMNIADVVTGYSKLVTGFPDLAPCDQCPPEERL